jgi:hypothetical protein
MNAASLSYEAHVSSLGSCGVAALDRLVAQA